jgi:chemotaxis protein methyltransferase CheR
VFEKTLDKNGYLFLGPSESLMRRETSFAFDEIGQALVWRFKDRLGMSPRRNAVSPAPKPAPPADKPIFAPLPVPRHVSFPIPREIKKDETHYENAIGYFQIKKLEKAEREFQEQLRITPDHVPSLVGLAHLYAGSGRDTLAFDHCQRIVKIDNLIADAYFIQGLILFGKKDFMKASTLFKKTVYCDEKHFVAQYFLALTYKEFHQTEHANRQFRVAIHAIDEMGADGLTRELAGHCGNYILSLCIDNVT